MPFIEPTPHNVELGLPDRLTTLTMNYLWRRFIADALTAYFEKAIPPPSADVDVQATWINFHNLILDLYDSEIGLQILRIATIQAKASQIYPLGSESRILYDIAETPYYFDPDGLFIVADNVFRAQEAGVYGLVTYIRVQLPATAVRVSIRRVGDAEYYAVSETEGDITSDGYLNTVGLFLANVADEFEVTITTTTTSVGVVEGYAAFVRLGGL